MAESRCAARAGSLNRESSSSSITHGAASTSSAETTARNRAASVITRLVYASPPSGSLRIARTSCGTSTALKMPPARRM